MRMLLSEDRVVKRDVCRAVLESLPEWFGDPKAIEDYVQAAARLPTLIAFSDPGDPVGFLCLERLSPERFGIHVMGVLAPYHGLGLGRSLIAGAERYARGQGASTLEVRTLSARAPSAAYAGTRDFYARMGFVKAGEDPDYWGPQHPCLVLTKQLL